MKRRPVEYALCNADWYTINVLAYLASEMKPHVGVCINSVVKAFGRWQTSEHVDDFIMIRLQPATLQQPMEAQLPRSTGVGHITFWSRKQKLII